MSLMRMSACWTALHLITAVCAPAAAAATAAADEFGASSEATEVRPDRLLVRGAGIDLPATHAARSRHFIMGVGGGGLWVSPTTTAARRGRRQPGRLPLAAPVTGLAAVDDRAFLAMADGRLLTVDLGSPSAIGMSRLSLERPAGGPIRLAAMDDHLVLAESGFGISLVEVNPPHACGQPVHLDGPLPAVGTLALDAELIAVAASDRMIYAATRSGEILVVDARVPALPRISGRMPFAAGVRALAANGARLYVLAEDGLHALDTAGEPPLEVLRRPDIEGTALTLAGRELQVGSDAGLITWLDADPAPQIIRVTVGNNYFSPQDLVIRPGDSVSWRNLSGFHNVLSCDDYGFGCDLGPAQETFTSGPVSGPPWIFTYTFTREGLNPYRCVPHTPFMIGTVSVELPPPPPLQVDLDIRPGSCTNPFNPSSRGVLPVAVLGRPDLDVATIETASLRLAGIGPLRWAFEDVGSPAPPTAGGDGCEAACPGDPDGILDMTLKFDSAAIAAAIGAPDSAACLPVELTGSLSGEPTDRPIIGRDAVRLRPARVLPGR